MLKGPVFVFWKSDQLNPQFRSQVKASYILRCPQQILFCLVVFCQPLLWNHSCSMRFHRIFLIDICYHFFIRLNLNLTFITNMILVSKIIRVLNTSPYASCSRVIDVALCKLSKNQLDRFGNPIVSQLINRIVFWTRRFLKQAKLSYFLMITTTNKINLTNLT